jgi:hypothetical protein
MPFGGKTAIIISVTKTVAKYFAATRLTGGC